MTNKRRIFHREDFGKAEIALAEKHGIPLYLVFFDIINNVLYEPVQDDGREDFTFSLDAPVLVLLF